MVMVGVYIVLIFSVSITFWM